MCSLVDWTKKAAPIASMTSSDMRCRLWRPIIKNLLLPRHGKRRLEESVAFKFDQKFVDRVGHLGLGNKHGLHREACSFRLPARCFHH